MHSTNDKLIQSLQRKVTEDIQAKVDIDPHALCLQAASLSDFVARNLVQQPELVDFLRCQTIQDTQTLNYAQLLEHALTGIAVDASNALDTLNKTLRLFRQRYMLLLACQDLLNLQDIESSLKKVSALADALIMQAYHWLYRYHGERFGFPDGEFGQQPLIILGMGKLGGRELNFSSDIDLIFCFPANGEIQGPRRSIEHQQFFTKLAQKLIAALNQTTVDGQVFRVDMRLRPFGDSGPLVMHFDAIEDYYQEQGREWERFAMVKARILNQDCAYTDSLQTILKPFVYRRYLDYSAIDSLRKMKSLITQEVRRRGLKNNIKLGQGGIREVEFIVQSFQLIKGGRETDLQATSLISTLTRLVAHHLLPAQEANNLLQSYLFLRKVEHCLQQFDDQQTQVLPDTPVDQARLSQIMAMPSYAAFEKKLEQHMQIIHEQFTLLVGDEGGMEEQEHDDEFDTLNDLWLLDLSAQEMSEVLAQWQDCPIPQGFYQQLIDFKHTLRKRGVTSRGLDTLNALMPATLQHCFALLQDQDIAQNCEALLSRIIDILSAILGRTTYLQLLVENPGALKQLVKLCLASEWIAQQIRRYPILLDELLTPQTLYSPTKFEDYPGELRQTLLRVEPDDLELQMELLRQFKQIQQLKIAAADVTGVLPVMKVSDHLTYLAEAIIAEVVNMAWRQMATKYGTPPDTSEQDKRFAVIGYGKLGGIELGYGSDLDLVFVHNSETEPLTNGPKQIESGLFYTKLAQRIMHLFMTNTSSGRLYEIDMRLRPSGNAGLLVCHIQGFKKYQLHEAWTWEHQALVRARMVYASEGLSEEFRQIRHQVLTQPRERAQLQKEVVEMRQKMRQNLSQGSQFLFDLKQDDGAMVDIEFLIQYWVLANVGQFPELSKWSDNVRITDDLLRFELITAEQARLLMNAYLDYRNTTHRLTLLGKKATEQKHLFAESQRQVSAIWQNTFADTIV